MSTRAIYTTFCDRCGDWDVQAESRSESRRIAKRLGWQLNRSEDLCGVCLGIETSAQRTLRKRHTGS